MGLESWTVLTLGLGFRVLGLDCWIVSILGLGFKVWGSGLAGAQISRLMQNQLVRNMIHAMET